jgi:hypothetical protein
MFEYVIRLKRIRLRSGWKAASEVDSTTPATSPLPKDQVRSSRKGDTKAMRNQRASNLRSENFKMMARTAASGSWDLTTNKGFAGIAGKP